MISVTDSVKDRLAAFYHWKDQQSLEQAVLIARDHATGSDEQYRLSLLPLRPGTAPGTGAAVRRSPVTALR